MARPVLPQVLALGAALYLGALEVELEGGVFPDWLPCSSACSAATAALWCCCLELFVFVAAVGRADRTAAISSDVIAALALEKAVVEARISCIHVVVVVRGIVVDVAQA